MRAALLTPDRRWLWPLLASLTLLLVLLSLSSGPLAISTGESLAAALALISGHGEAAVAPEVALVVGSVRLPRTLMAIAVGALLGQCGAVMQGLFRNPLADPGIIGVAAGAALGAALFLVIWPTAGPLAVPVAAFGGGLASTALVYAMATRDGHTSIPTLLLAGVAVSALTGAAIGLLTYIADDLALRDLSLWQMGSLAGAQWQQLAVTVPTAVVISWRFQRAAQALNALLLGEAEARHLGIDVSRLKRELILWSALGVGVAVAATGIIGFIGLVVPHLVRMLVGPDHRLLLPLSAAGGALMLLAADIGARTLAAPAEMPVGLVTTLIGVPFFIVLLRRQRHI